MHLQRISQLLESSASILFGQSKILRDPVQRELAHEEMRFYNICDRAKELAFGGDLRNVVDKLLDARFSKITDPQKMLAFAWFLTNENYHTMAQKVYDKLSAMGYTYNAG